MAADWPSTISGYSKPVPIGDGYFVSGCEACGAAVLIDERHHEGDGRDRHSEWHEQEAGRTANNIQRLLAQRDMYS